MSTEQIDPNVCAGMDAGSRRGDWMQTYTGRAFYPLDPSPDQVDPADIAHALSLICRYGGHVRDFYSVAEHCVLMSYAVPEEYALWALLHDATEAYVGDMVRPLKRQIPAYMQIENNIMLAVLERFSVPREDFLDVSMPAIVKEADNRILLNERAALLSESELPWHPFFDTIEPLDVTIRAWEPRDAEMHYQMRLSELLG